LAALKKNYYPPVLAKQPISDWHPYAKTQKLTIPFIPGLKSVAIKILTTSLVIQNLCETLCSLLRLGGKKYTHP